MTATDRKNQTESILKHYNIPIGAELQVLAEESEVKLRGAAEIARRILILTYLNIVVQAEGFRNKVVASLKNKGLWDDVSGNEKLLLLKKELTEQDGIFISWQAEAVWMLLWVIGKVKIHELPAEECDINEILKLLPSFQEGPDTFVNGATIRSADDIMNMLDLIYRIHWAVSDAEVNELPIPADMNPGVVHERHYALNWVINFIEQWDQVEAN